MLELTGFPPKCLSDEEKTTCCAVGEGRKRKKERRKWRGGIFCWEAEDQARERSPHQATAPTLGPSLGCSRRGFLVGRTRMSYSRAGLSLLRTEPQRQTGGYFDFEGRMGEEVF